MKRLFIPPLSPSLVLFSTPSPPPGNFGPCPRGRYCGPQTKEPLLCPIGTFGDREGLTEIGDCTPCLGGHYCETEGLEAPTGPCDPGYFCVQGAKVKDNQVTDKTGGPCPQSYYCPEGT